ncbi:predicted protein [Lichtheimia corymbifera JMRC:FSU:9682]|uniref:Uncharacterized protein n=1 Tax=Lichtheimia corymbifera JMRC:FSU:9682 TaxID=1263082 RepID=A0A068RWB3_9FUNG|nr:predicted protein [Lichtheimia corymbifera JMRC:FSU:9682]
MATTIVKLAPKVRFAPTSNIVRLKTLRFIGLYENDVVQHDREHLLTKFRRRQGQDRRARPYTLFMFPSFRRLSYIQGFHNELWGLYGNEIAQRGGKGVV